MPQVIVIQPIAEQTRKLRVAAYARVSSDSADQLNSFATQVDSYTSYIRSKGEWEFAGLYADEAVSGTTADKYILTNEKYIGDALVQKSFTPDEIPLRKIQNNGQMPKHYIQDSHPAIISREAFKIVQRLLKEKAELHTSKTPIHAFPLSRKEVETNEHWFICRSGGY